MDLEWARSLLDAERTRVPQLLANLGVDRTDDHEAERDASYPAHPLAQQRVDDAVAAGLRDRLAALDRARQWVEDGTYGRRSSGGAITSRGSDGQGSACAGTSGVRPARGQRRAAGSSTGCGRGAQQRAGPPRRLVQRHRAVERAAQVVRP
jgi:DnaK suppressor protein